MARLLVAADLTSLAQRSLAERLAAQAQSHGHEASVVLDAPLPACKEADAAICLLDGANPAGMAVALAATAHALNLPTLALHTHALPTSLASLFTQAVAVTREEDLAEALPAFYAQVRPFAGKLVRDQVPRLVREAGHQVQFREAGPDERARYLKRKVVDEATELLEADPGAEREEVADLLEALETLLRVRGFDRDDLKLVKEAKRKRRGGFERFLIVESASTANANPLPEPAASWPREPPSARQPDPEPEPAAFAFPDLEPTPEPEPEIAAPSWLAAEPTPAERPRPAPEPLPSASGFQLPSWLSSAPVPAANPTTRPAAPTTTYEPAPAPFQPPAIPSFRPEKPAPMPAGRRSSLWNLGKKGEPEEIPETVEDPDRVEPRIREI